MQRAAKGGIGWQVGIIGSAVEAAQEALAEIAHVAVSRVHPQHGRLVAAGLRIGGGPAHHLRPVGSQPLHMLRMLIGA